jgi:D-alanyl-D-alanine dipeptidase
MLVLATAICAKGIPQRSSPLADSTQLIVVTTANWSAIDGSLRRYQRTTSKTSWEPVGDPIAVAVGKTGLGWGIGMATIPAHPPEDPVKQEGDRKAPAGIFHIGTAFGDAPAPSSGWKMPYQPLTSSIECVDDPQSKFYNHVVDRASVKPDWNSSEHMRDVGDAYRWGAVVGQNPRNQPRAGSCVFLHIWAGAGIGTEGCTAMAEPHIEALLAWLNPVAHPVLVQLPLPQYRQAEKALHLPSL